MPDPAQSTCILKDTNEQCTLPSSADAFVIPGWGGVSLLQRSQEDSEILPVDDLKTAMGYAVAHIRRLFGAPCGASGQCDSTAVFIMPENAGIADWERDIMIRSWTVR